jgi:DNA-directed RNA polymerase subunit RPC12/RpoP
MSELVAGCHRDFKRAGLNPSLTDVRHELYLRHEIELDDIEVGDFLLEAGKRGYSNTSDKASTMSKVSSQIAAVAVRNKNRDGHQAAVDAHTAAAAAHRKAASYHDGQVDFHRDMARACAANRAPIAFTDAEKQARKSIDAAEKTPADFHCANCDTRFSIANATQTGAEQYKCPSCGERVLAATVQDVDENQQPTEAQRTPWAWLDESFTGPPKAAEQKENARQLIMLDCARAASSRLSDSPPDYLMYMPAGIHQITPSQNGRPVTVTVLVDSTTADTLEKQRELLAASGHKPFFSIQHDTQVAAFWPTKFSWDTRPDSEGKPVTGVFSDGLWSKSGLEAVEGKDFRTFSPTFFVSAVRNDPDNPVHVVCNKDAKLAMGSVVNDPAFVAMSPLWQ